MPTNYEPLVLTIEPAYVGSAVSPTVDITETTDDVTVTITDINGEHSYTVEKTDQAIADAEAAASAANSAASAASTAATRADTSADNADTATTAANSAAAAAAAATVDTEAATAAANSAASSATSSAASANSAATSATNAASAANSAASDANAKATLADTAASNANTKAGLADTAANAANTAAQSASSAASTASTAATNADTKATAANTAASAASTAATAANDAAARVDAALETLDDDLKITDSASGESVTAADASYLNALVVNGKSVQDGTPTPENPVPVQVVDVISEGCIGLQIGDTVTPINLQGNVLASLPDGTKDELKIDSAGHVTIEKKTWMETISAVGVVSSSGTYASITPSSIDKRVNWDSTTDMASDVGTASPQMAYCSMLPPSQNSIHIMRTWNGIYIYSPSGSTMTQSDIDVLVGATFVARNKTQIIDLGYITPPAISSGSVITILATLTPTITPSWWTSRAAAIPEALAANKQHIEDTSADDASIAPVESSTAVANHSVGALIMLDGMLYKVTTAIATGEAITPGTNCTQTTVAAELAALA